MKGKYRVIVQDKRIRYDFTIHRNITVIRGDSATGKTTLLDMLTAYATAGAESGTTVSCEKNCTVLTGMDWKNRLSGIHDSLVFMDELARFTASEDFAAAIRNTDNYYIIVSREPLANLPYSVDEIYGIRTSGKYGGLKQTYNEFYRIYGSRDSLVYQDPSLVIIPARVSWSSPTVRLSGLKWSGSIVSLSPGIRLRSICRNPLSGSSCAPVCSKTPISTRSWSLRRTI